MALMSPAGLFVSIFFSMALMSPTGLKANHNCGS
jgi:hypothetical protein